MVKTYGKAKPFDGREDALSVLCAHRLKRLPGLPAYTKIMNERKTAVVTNKRTGQKYSPAGMKNKAMGVVAGAPDFNIWCPSGQWHGLLIELKVKGGRLSEDQKMFIEQVSLKGYFVGVVYSVEGLEECLSEYFGTPVKELRL